MERSAELASNSARARIVETAQRLFYADGVRATGIDKIIASSGVAKMSFYRHFPSKADLVVAFLEERHARWMAWFTDRVGASAAAGGPALPKVADVLGEWFADRGFRGCAFINVVAETTEPRAHAVAARHKDDLAAYFALLARTDAIADPERAGRLALVIVDGAIIRAQMAPYAGLVADTRALLAGLARL